MVTTLMWMQWVGLLVAAGAKSKALPTYKLFTLDAVAMPCAPLDSRTQTTNLKMMPNKKAAI
tara:strand:+ start:242 stop:427 length:186 start_codon:yes stop_codon:yes gene_type:complete